MDTNWQKYIQLGQEVQNQNVILAFYLKTYSCELMVKQYKDMKASNDPDLVKMSNIITQTFNELEQTKNSINQLKNKDQNKQQIINYIQENLQSIDQALNQGVRNVNNITALEKNIAYIDSLQQFGPLTPELTNLRNQANQRLTQAKSQGVQQKTKSDDQEFNVPEEGGREQCKRSVISMQNNQQFLNNQVQPNNVIDPNQQDTYYQEAFNMLSQSRINDMDKNSIQRILEVTQSFAQLDLAAQQNIPSKIQSQVSPQMDQQQRIKSIYHPPNFDLFNMNDGQPQSNQDISLNNQQGLDNNFGTPNPDILNTSSMKKLNDQQSGVPQYGNNSPLYGNLNTNNNNFGQPPQDVQNNYFYQSNNTTNNPQQPSNFAKPKQPEIDNFGTPNPDFNLNQINQQNQFFQQQPPSNQFPQNGLQPSQFNNNNNNNINNNYPQVGQQPQYKQPSTIQQKPVFDQQPKQQQQVTNQSKLYPMSQQTTVQKPKSNGLIKIQAIKLCEQTIQQMKSASVEQVKQNLSDAIKLLDEIQV